MGSDVASTQSIYHLVSKIILLCVVWTINFLNVQFSDERDAIQKKTFTKWVNKHLKKVSLTKFEIWSFFIGELYRSKFWIPYLERSYCFYCNTSAQLLIKSPQNSYHKIVSSFIVNFSKLFQFSHIFRPRNASTTCS